MKKNWLLPFLSIAIVSCGPGTEDTTKQKSLENAKNLQQVYLPYAGKYSGDVINKTDDPIRVNKKLKPYNKVPVVMELFLEQVQDGVDENNQPKYTTIIRGIYQRQDIDPEYVPLVKRPIQGTTSADANELYIKNSDTIIGPNPSLWSVKMTARLTETGLAGDIVYDTNQFGSFQFKRIK